MTAALDRQAIWTLKVAITQSPSDRVIGLGPLTNSNDTSVGPVQVHLDKSFPSYKTFPITSYPLHITLFNFSDSSRRIDISSNFTLLIYIPIYFLLTSSFPDGG